MSKKSLKELALDITEDEYRKDPALSFSTLSRFDREGFDKLSDLNEEITSPSLVFGSAVDCWITEGIEAFTERFTIADIPSIQPAVKSITEALFSSFSALYESLHAIPRNEIENKINESAWQPRWNMDTKLEKVLEQGEPLYSFMLEAKDKTILSLQTYQEVERCVLALKSSDTTKFYFNEEDDDVERLYQLKFKKTLNGVDYRCMMDECIVDHKNKVIIPIDLKTSSKKEWNFFKSFVKWNYHMQARLYYRLLLETIKNDDYFKDFTILDYRFIVINKESLTPLVWEFPMTKVFGDIQFGKNNAYTMHDPELVGRTLRKYLDESPRVPYGISLEMNNIAEWLTDYTE